jgi:hypothetical protein
MFGVDVHGEHHHDSCSALLMQIRWEKAVQLGDPLTITFSQAAQISGLSVWTLMRRADADQLKTTKVGNRRLVRMDSLREFLGLDKEMTPDQA